MIVTNPSILARIEWCWWQSTQALTEPELDGWRAEAEGLRDALLNRDHMNHYRDSPPSVFERYVMGFEDGQALIRLAWVERHVATIRQDDTYVLPIPSGEPDYQDDEVHLGAESFIKQTT